MSFGRILLLISVSLLVFSWAAAQQEQVEPTQPNVPSADVEKCLAAITSPSPFVLPIVPARWSSPPQSIHELAKVLGFVVFDQDGISVLGTAERLDIGAIFDGRIQKPKSLEAAFTELLLTLEPRQLQTMGSTQGLSLSMLTPEQQELIASIFGPNHAIVKLDGNVDRVRALQSAVSADSLPILSLRIHGWIETSRLEVRTCPGGVPFSKGDMVVGSSISSAPAKGMAIMDRSGASANQQLMPGLPVPNTLKASDLDYSLPALATPIPIQGKVSLSSLIASAAKETGLNLMASPGSEAVFIYVSTPGLEAGKLLKAVSLATTGTWRKLGSGFMFAQDKIGLGQISARMRQLKDDPQMADLSLAMSWFSPGSQSNPIHYLPLPAESEFPLTSEQLNIFRAGTGSLDTFGLTWNQLTPEQQAFVKGTVRREYPKPGDQAQPPTDPSQWQIMPHLQIRMTFSCPNFEDMEISGSSALGVFPPNAELQLVGGMWTDVPRGYAVVLNKPFRACIHKPSRIDSPGSLISDFQKRGFNAIFLRVLADGYAAVPSKQFPTRVGLDADYLDRVISAAHSKGMKIIGVIDVLRWSDGSRDHWVRKKTDLLDYDIFGRCRSDWARFRKGWFFETTMAEFVFGENFSGDAVSPFSPEVASMLTAFLGELSEYGLDGLALDYTTMIHPGDGPEFEGMAAGSPGHHPLARAKFLADAKADSIDAAVGRSSDLGSLPLQAMVQASTSLQSAWHAQYVGQATDLTLSLARKWSQANQDSPVYLVNSFLTPQGSLDWPKLKGAFKGVLQPAIEFRAPTSDIPIIPLLRAPENMGTMLFYGTLSGGLGYPVEEAFKEINLTKWDTQGVVIDFTNSGRRKNDFLRIIQPPKDEPPK